MTSLLAVGDPLLETGVDWGDVAVVLVKVGATFGVLLVAVMLMIWFERKLIADIQNRIGPNRAGPFGILQTLADGVKLFFKEDLLPDRADRRVFKLAPYLSIVPAFLAFSIVPIGGVVEIFGKQTRLQLADPPVGILFLLAMSSVSVYGVMLAGWSSGSKYPLLGSVRATAQMVSYEAALGLSIAAVVLVTGSLSITDIVAEQSAGFFGWNVVRLGVVPFAVFLIAATAELNRPPFDLTEAEQELVGGFHTEYSSIRFAMFFLAEFMNTITMSAIMVTLFLGGPGNPLGASDPSILPWLWPILWFLLKTVLLLAMYVWFRATLPRLRYDQLMDLGWKWLIPLSLVWLLLLATVLIGGDDRTRFMRLGLALGLALLVGAAISRAVQVGRERRDDPEEVNV